MSDVPVVKLGDVTTKVGSGATPRGGEAAYKSSGIPLIRSMNVHFDGFRRSGLAYLDEEQARALKNVEVRAGDVLLNITGASIGRVTVAPTAMDGARVNQHVCIIRPDLRLDSSFLRWYLSSPLQQRLINGIESGATRQALTKEKILGFVVPLLPLSRQRAIVAELEKQFSRLDEAVANLKRVKANLTRYKAAVLKAAVEGRLVPTEAELADREGRTYESGTQLMERIRQAKEGLWTGRGKYKQPLVCDDASLPKLPRGWVWVAWDQIGFSQNGRPFPSREYCDLGVRLLRPGNLHDSGVVSWTKENTRHMPTLYLEENPDLVVRQGELVMNLTAQSLKDEFLGRVCLTTYGEQCLLNQRLARLTPIEISPKFAFIVFKSRWFRRFVDGLNTGSLIQHMFTSQLAKFPFPLPPLAEQLRIIAEFDQCLERLSRVQRDLDSVTRHSQFLRNATLSFSFVQKATEADS